MKSRQEQRLEELARRRKFHPLPHRYHPSPHRKGHCLICGFPIGDHEDEPPDQEEPGEAVSTGDSAPASAGDVGGTVGGRSTGGAAPAA